jgi:hypothetical protein
MPKGVYERKKTPAIERFQKLIRILPNGCWLWLGTVVGSGYGQFWDGTKKVYAHIWSYEHFVGPVPDGKELGHLPDCHNRLCVNPGHLHAVTHRENLMESETSTALNAAKTHCVNGHEYTPENTIVGPEGWRECKACRKEKNAEWYKNNRDDYNRRRREKRLQQVPKKKTERKLTVKTHCPHGHEFTTENTMWTKRGSKICRICHRAAGARSYQQNREEISRRRWKRRHPDTPQTSAALNAARTQRAPGMNIRRRILEFVGRVGESARLAEQ